MMRRVLAIVAGIVAVFGSTVFARHGEPSAEQNVIEFEGRKWSCDAPDRLVVREYGEKTALCIQGERMTSSIFLPDVEFRNGTIEVDIAVPSRSVPGIGFRGRENGYWCNRIMFKRWPGKNGDKHDVVEQALVTRRTSTVFHLNIRKAGQDGIRQRPGLHDWFHVKVVVQDDIVKVFLNGSEEPSIELGAMFDGGEKGVLGLCGKDCYFANFQFTRAPSEGAYFLP